MLGGEEVVRRGEMRVRCGEDGGGEKGVRRW